MSAKITKRNGSAYCTVWLDPSTNELLNKSCEASGRPKKVVAANCISNYLKEFKSEKQIKNISDKDSQNTFVESIRENSHGCE